LPRPSKRAGRDTTEVANARQHHIDELLHKDIHPIAAQGDLAADAVSLTQAEVGDGFFSDGDDRFFCPEISARSRTAFSSCLGSCSPFADAHVDDDFRQARDLHRVFL
jgi:hypothetical protein